jgi:hypothetical protein
MGFGQARKLQKLRCLSPDQTIFPALVYEEFCSLYKLFTSQEKVFPAPRQSSTRASSQNPGQNPLAAIPLIPRVVRDDLVDRLILLALENAVGINALKVFQESIDLFTNIPITFGIIDIYILYRNSVEHWRLNAMSRISLTPEFASPTPTLESSSAHPH